MNKLENAESIYIKIEELVDSGMKIGMAIKKLGYDIVNVKKRLSVAQWESIEKARREYLLRQN